MKTKLNIMMLFAILTFGKATAQVDHHIVLVTIDGLIPEFYSEEKWPAPNLKELVKNGVSSDGVRGVFPSVTYPSHTTIITGAFPENHGIYYNTYFDPENVKTGWVSQFEEIQAQTLWESVKKAGGSTAAIEWPVTIGKPECIDYNVPEGWPADRSNDFITYKKSMTTPAGLLDEMEGKSLGKLESDTYKGMLKDEKSGEIAAYMIEKYQPNFIAVHLIDTDHSQHVNGRASDHEVPMALAVADRAIGRMREAVKKAGIEDKTTFIITGDHGFSTLHTKLCPNTLLMEKGWVTKEGTKGEWEAYFQTSGASAFLHMKDPKNKKLAEKILETFESSAYHSKYYRIVKRKELDDIGADPRAAFAIAPKKGVGMSGTFKGDFVQKAGGGTHGFFPTDFDGILTGLIISGAGVPEPRRIEEVNMEDIAPTISEILKINHPSKDGTPIFGVIQ
ncbi:alkaline phosphatase family protein [Flammeovirga yaeyamensis]|uniref:Alkaline phosphatase family protein n=1 Tax=Flammeovirga yaeyamensis TaxID=367791 RepID=A0AAX1N6P1_9BACT|nr:ectonucleotide pyrophosphatase/phosphodiesterase [Flammeovirga yaeyamensis]MBB3697722.1 putative AlkP superfamily pyrophosphatase or phosphodiesterase [Flammeovirga yaeyamensis]NMF35920.1 alkaline phosphatase family protein [Flammeovirga yaeyamensis]QWG03130.1 alkaline phosphatase family protein [Flammeovirga yaeyamensis]